MFANHSSHDIRPLRRLVLCLFISSTLLALNCAETDEGLACHHSSYSVLNDNDICLVFELNGLSSRLKNTIEDKVASGISQITELMPINSLDIRIVENPNMIPSGFGIGGFNPSQEEIIIALDINFSGLEKNLEDDLISLLAHEIHHAKRRRSVGYGSTLLQAVISEGLADHFSIEVAGIAQPPWSTALEGPQLQEWISSAKGIWNETPYNHNAWFLGTNSNIPKWTGYSIGFELVRKHLTDNPEELPSKLHDKSASSFSH
ncbi:DUF2268 domain-containing putative Zn-dependent protease [Roseivirga sp. E12]|uniref:DUF2268 domain-containing putative Zn-dependent protease n=1 Tax=Roseivirga sp. E12 TaxID=2819237 RepID=UPI001ABCC6B8|nr:DUF2268 domain-containing putative Zn-dependent protease [Roseivirga sp. E12]MBO3697065.1 hypothetical protein [Roseivirga sp. E12]